MVDLDATQALDLSQYDESDDEPEPQRKRKLVGHLKVFRHQDFEEKVYEIFEGENVIGRDERSDVFIPRKSLSKSHACIEVSDNLHLIYDNSSKNKTRRDKVVLKPQVRYELKTGDLLTLADLTCQYFQGDIKQDDDDTGSETGSESMLPIDSAAHDVTDDNQDDSSKIFAADTASDTDDGQGKAKDPIVYSSDEAKVHAKETVSKAHESTDDEKQYKPKVPNVLYDSNDDDDDEQMTKGTPYPDHCREAMLDASADSGTLAFGLISPSDRPVIRPTPKQAVETTSATLLDTSDTRGDIAGKTLVEDTPATLLYSTDTQDKSVDIAGKTLVEDTPATLLYSTDTQDKSIDISATAIVTTPATLLYSSDSQDKSAIDSPSKHDDTIAMSTVIYEPETQGFSPNETSLCEPMQAYIQESPLSTPRAEMDISNIPDSEDDEEAEPSDSEVKKVLFDESATQAYVWNDSDATDDDDDDLRFQPTQAYPVNPTPGSKEETSTDEASNPDLYATSLPDLHISGLDSTTEMETKACSDDGEHSDTKEDIGPVTIVPTLAYGVEEMETQAYEPEAADMSSTSRDIARPKSKDMEPTLPMETQAYVSEGDLVSNDLPKPQCCPKGKDAKRTEVLQPTLPYNTCMMETLAYDVEEDVSDSNADIPKPNSNQERKDTAMLETQAYDAEIEEDSPRIHRPESPSTKDSPVVPTIPYDVTETEARDCDDGREKTEDLVIQETQAYGTEGDSDTDDETSENVNNEKQETKEMEARDCDERREKTEDLVIQETQVYGTEGNSDTDDETSENVNNEKQETKEMEARDCDDGREKTEDLVIQETQAYGTEGDSDTDDEASTNVKIKNQETNVVKDAVACKDTQAHGEEVQCENSASDKGVTLTVDVCEATQAYGLDDQIDQEIPDSEEMLSQEIPPHEIKDDITNNNMPTCSKTGKEQKTVSFEDTEINPNKKEVTTEAVQEPTEIVVRPTRRGRGRVTQPSDEEDQPINTEIQEQTTSRGKRGKSSLSTSNVKEEPKSTRSKRSGKNEKQTISTPQEAQDTEGGLAELRKGNTVNVSAMEESKPTRSSRAKRTKGSKIELEKEDTEGSAFQESKTSPLNIIEAATERPKSTRNRRSRKSAKMVPGATVQDTEEEKQASEETSVDTTVVEATRSASGRRSRKSAKNRDTEATVQDTEEEKQASEETSVDTTVVEATRSASGRRSRKSAKGMVPEATAQKEEAVEVETTNENEETKLETTIKQPKSSRGRRKKNAKGVVPGVSGTTETEEDDVQVESTNEETKLDTTVAQSKSSRSRRKKRVVLRTPEVTAPEEEVLVEVESTNEETKLDTTVAQSKSSRSRRKNPKGVVPGTSETTAPEEEETAKHTTKADTIVEETKSSRARGTRKSEKDIPPEAIPLEEVDDNTKEEAEFKYGRGKKSKKNAEKTKVEIPTLEDDKDNKKPSEQNKRTTSAASPHKIGQTGKSEESTAKLRTEIPRAQALEDSEEDQFVSKGKELGKRKGKATKIAIVEDEFSEMDSEGLPSLETILSDKKPQQKSTRKKTESEAPITLKFKFQGSPSPLGSKRRGKRRTPTKAALDDTQDSVECATESLEGNGGSQGPVLTKAASSRRGRGRVTQPDDSIPGPSLEASMSHVDHEDIMSPMSVAKSLSTRRGKNKMPPAKPDTEVSSTPDAADVSQTISDSQSSTSSVGSKARGKRGRSTRAADVTQTEDVQATPAKRKKDQSKDEIQSPSLRDRKQTMPKVMFTGVTDKQGEKVVTSLGGTLEDSVYKCTHLITDKVRRTVKFLCGVASGQVIVLPSWLTECKKNKSFIDPEPFLVKDKAAEKLYSFSLKQSHEQALKGGLLDGYKVHVTKNVKPEPLQMKDIIQCAKGEYLPRIPRSMEDNVLVISCDADSDACKPALACGIPVYTAELLLSGVLRHELSLDQNRLFTETPQDTPTAKNTSRKRRNESVDTESSQSASRSSKRKKK